jgi:kynurenine formamidase
VLRTMLWSALVAVAMTAQATDQAPAKRLPRNAAEFDELFQQVSNWGRWGRDDQLGSVNLVTVAKRQQAIALAKAAISVSLAQTSMTESAADNPRPLEHSMNPRLSRPPLFALMDTYGVSYHGVAHSHLDALCHVLYKDRGYNGFTRSEIDSERGCTKLGVENLKSGLITRGVLLDIPRLHNVPYLEPGTPIFVEELEAWERKSGVRLGDGDALILRTGRWARRDKVGPWSVAERAAGLDASVASWIKARGVALIGSDAALDVLPSRVDGVYLPVHLLMIAALGINLLDNQNLEALANTAVKLNRWEFMLTVAPVPVAGGTGAPVNVLATF